MPQVNYDDLMYNKWKLDMQIDEQLKYNDLVYIIIISL